jgi:hypothetical protein
MPKATDSSLTAFITTYINHFASEARRLHDKAPLLEYKSLVDNLELVVKRLGTLEHAVAVAAVSKEYKHATREAAQAWSEIWSDFFANRRTAIELERNFGDDAHIREVESAIRKLEISSADEGDEELTRAFRSLLTTYKEVEAARLPLSKGWRRFPWLMLRSNLQVYAVYLQYLAARILVWLMHHGFIILIPIVIFGFLFSFLESLIKESTAWLTGSWLAVVLVLLGLYVFKTYYIDRKIEGWQVKFEARWLRSIALKIFFARTLALLSRTRSRKSSLAA